MNLSKSIFVLAALTTVLCFGNSVAQADSFVSQVDASQVVGTTTETGTAIATFTLDESQDNLSYEIAIFGLELKSDPGTRTDFSDVTAIHLHNGFAGSNGPHVLNIFGIPSEDDDEMVVDFANNTISGIYNDADAFDDSGTLVDQNNPLNTKLLSNFVDDLLSEQIYIAIHTAGQNGNIAIRGQVLSIPEPSGALLALSLTLALVSKRRRRP